MFPELQRVRVDFVGFRDDDARLFHPREVVENGCGSILTKDVAKRNDGELIDGLDGPLRGRIVCAQRLDRVADELEPHGVELPGRIDVQDAATNRELAMLV